MDKFIIKKRILTSEERQQMRADAQKVAERARALEQERERLVAEGKMEKIITFVNGAMCIKYRKIKKT